jgi:hypothetical protein
MWKNDRVLITFMYYYLILVEGTGRIDNNTTLDKDTTFGRTLVQVDSTVIVGVLFFLTLYSYLGFLPEYVGRSIIGILTLTAIIPFVTSAFFVIREDKASTIAKSFTKYGFVYLAVNLIATITLPFFADLIPVINILPSQAEKCVKEPSRFNVTHIWQCSMFDGGTLAEKCSAYPGRYDKDNESQCSSLIPPGIRR